MASLPIAQLLGADYNAAHFNHIHVSGKPLKWGTPPINYPGWTDPIKKIYDALEDHFGPGAYFLDVAHHWEKDLFVIDDPDIYWTHMGVYNRRKIGTGNTWSQHAWANGLDIGPYLGMDQQAPFREFLKRTDHGKLPVMKVRKPSWLPDEVLTRLQNAGVLLEIPTEETEDMWRFLVFLDRAMRQFDPGSDPNHKHAITLTGTVLSGPPF